MRRDRRHPVARWLLTVTLLALLATAVVGYRLDWDQRLLERYGDEPPQVPAVIEPPAGLELPARPAPTPVATIALPTALVRAKAVEAALANGLKDKDLGQHVVAAVGDLTGAGSVWTHDDSQFMPASTTKVLTSTAALATLGPDTTFDTLVVAGASPREVVLVGGGDPYLAGKRPDEATYPERADIVSLARATARALKDRKRVRLLYDDSLFSGPTNNPKWRADYIPDDVVTPITALWVDRGVSPTGYGRVDDPSLSAAESFAKALSKAGVQVVGKPTRGIASPTAATLASVESAPVAQIVEHLLDVSDNETAEVLAHHVGLAVSGDGSFKGGADGVLTTLRSLGIATGTDVVYDGSGLSRHNRLSAATLLQAFQAAARPDLPDLRSLLTGLPVAGFTGSLADRFATTESDAVAFGDVRAKTGTLTGVSSLAGLVTGRDGTQMVFVLAADKTGKASPLDVEAALDGLAADLAACRCGAPG